MFSALIQKTNSGTIANPKCTKAIHINKSLETVKFVS